MQMTLPRHALAAAGLAGALALAAAAPATATPPEAAEGTEGVQAKTGRPYFTGDCHEHVLFDPDQGLSGRALVCLVGRHHGTHLELAARATITPGTSDSRVSVENVRLATPEGGTLTAVTEQRIGQTGTPLVVTTSYVPREGCAQQVRVGWSVRGADGELGRYHTGWDFDVCEAERSADAH